MRCIDHPNIVQLLDVLEDDKHYALILELMPSGSLQ